MLFAIITGVILYMAIGMLYYSPMLFGNRWVEILNIKDPKQPNYGLLSLVTIFTVILLYGILLISQAETVFDGLMVGGAVGIIIALAYAKDFIFGLGSASKNQVILYFIAIGYHFIALTIIGAVMMLF
ncbi:uncharacterized membrane-anchored protein YitT (DUF2179 family) [Evansella vedderi]|uniref:Uncharacterized membrane-anchored protein YitT (DUF2179 family) n=1 Tax=Evansella vedderi TaxID=38282 RepID=A0ABT9ZN45_9BACI|nr:DUF1761 domain-containing protein [Evansella vedderi]MDQ0252644.1 uncharacterized membrane-anchored protein YitT (DUF2179 family) [Evansella vedderi]